MMMRLQVVGIQLGRKQDMARFAMKDLLAAESIHTALDVHGVAPWGIARHLETLLTSHDGALLVATLEPDNAIMMDAVDMFREFSSDELMTGSADVPLYATVASAYIATSRGYFDEAYGHALNVFSYDDVDTRSLDFMLKVSAAHERDDDLWFNDLVSAARKDLGQVRSDYEAQLADVAGYVRLQDDK